jgi:hypothetical protein
VCSHAGFCRPVDLIWTWPHREGCERADRGPLHGLGQLTINGDTIDVWMDQLTRLADGARDRPVDLCRENGLVDLGVWGRHDFKPRPVDLSWNGLDLD